MGALLPALINILIALLSNERLHDVIINALDRKLTDSSNSVDDEYLEAQSESLREVLVDNKKPADGNIFLEQEKINQIKRVHRRKK